MTWFGWVWVWHRACWERVCSGPTLAECGRALSREADRLRVPDKRCVMTTGAVPSFTPKTIRRRGAPR
jgi:hypothetical protein